MTNLMEEDSLNKAELKELNHSIYQEADKLTEPLLFLMFLFGLFLATFYDTWVLAFGIGGINLFAYFITKRLLPYYTLHHYVFSAVSAIYAALYIYQMHGMAEMHFWVFISATILIIYQNWKLQLPLIGIVLLHHGTFAYLQYRGYSKIYFTQLDYMDMTSFIFHGLLASGVCLISGIWGYNLHQRTLDDTLHVKKLNQMKATLEANATQMKMMNEQLMVSNFDIKEKNDELRTSEEELLASGEELKQINENLNQLVLERTTTLLNQNNTLIHHAYISAHKVRGPLARILGLINLMNVEPDLQSKGKELLQHLNTSANELDDTLREVRDSLEKAEFKQSDN